MKKSSKTRQSDNNKQGSHTTNQAKSGSTNSVRIIGGQFKRRNVTFIDADGLRPTPDRLRETLFNWLLADVHGARVLDSCAGSGVLGFEALSRGAAHCTFIELNRTQSQMLSQSAQQLGIGADNYHIIHGLAEHVLGANQLTQPSFDIVFIDPPYADDLWQPILTSLITQALVTTDTLIYLEADKDLSIQLQQLSQTLSDIFLAQEVTGFDCLKQTKIGQVVAGLYRLSPSYLRSDCSAKQQLLFGKTSQ